MDIKGHFGEVSDGNKERLLESGGSSILVKKWQRTWLNFVLGLWKIELVSDEIGYLAEEISKQSIKGER